MTGLEARSAVTSGKGTGVADPGGVDTQHHLMLGH